MNLRLKEGQTKSQNHYHFKIWTNHICVYKIMFNHKFLNVLSSETATLVLSPERIILCFLVHNMDEQGLCSAICKEEPSIHFNKAKSAIQALRKKHFLQGIF